MRFYKEVCFFMHIFSEKVRKCFFLYRCTISIESQSNS